MSDTVKINEARLLSKNIGIVGILISTIMLVNYSNIIVFIKTIIELYIDVDGKIEVNQMISIKLILVSLLFIYFVFSMLLILNVNFGIRDKLNKIINLEQLTSFFINDPLSSKTKHTKYILIIGTCIGVLMHLYYLLFGTPKQEGYIENYSSVFFLFAIAVLLFTLPKVNTINLSVKYRNQFKLFVITVLIGLIFIYGEELSWGQHIFKWNSSEVFDHYNLQHETNVHNFINPLFRFIYPIVGMGSFIVLSVFWFFPGKEKNYLFDLIIPHRSLFFLVFIMACATYQGHSEIYEELLGVFAFLYSIRLFLCVRYPNKNYAKK